MEKILLLCILFFPFAGAFISYLIGRASKKARDIGVVVITMAELAMMITLAVLVLTGSFGASGADSNGMIHGQLAGAINAGLIDICISEICGMGLYFTVDGFRLIYGLVACFMWAMTALFSPEYFKHYRNRNRYYLFFLLTLGATLGVFFSADLFTTFIFFEIMSFTSYVWVAQDEKPAALRAAQTYLAVAVIGGMVLLMGLFLIYHALGTLKMSELMAAASTYDNKTLLMIAGICTFVGFGAKAGAFPLHIWLPKAHPVAPAPASALLSGILTKSGIFGLIVVTSNIFFQDMNWGSFLLILAVITMVGGAVLALFSVDLKRTLACSSMSQLGFILVGVAIMCMPFEENGLAMRGTLLHMVNHSLLKLILFMVAGVVFMNLHKLNLNEIRGFGRKKPFLNVIFALGTFGLMCLPFGNGYVSKTLLHEGIVEWIEAIAKDETLLAGLSPVFAGIFTGEMAFKIVEWLFLFSGGCTIGYMLKLYICLFVEENENRAVQKKYDEMTDYAALPARIALAVSAAMVPILGLVPSLLMDRIALLGEGIMHPEESAELLHYYSLECLKGSLISIVIGICVYLLVRRFMMVRTKQGSEYVDRWPAWLDLENLIYRPAILVVFKNVGILVASIPDTILDGAIVLLRKTIYRDRKLPHERMEGSAFTDFIGGLFDRDQNPEHIPLKHRLSVVGEELNETYSVIRRSMSFGLMLFCIGLICTLIYMVFLVR